MLSKRYHLTVGATTSSGGVVERGSHVFSIDGKQGVLIGDEVYCPACKRMGKISIFGPRLDETLNGVSVALEGDICVCGCKPSPVLVPNQTLRWQEIEVPDDAVVAAASAGVSSELESATEQAVHAIRFQAIDSITGDVLAHCPYFLMRNTDEVCASGVTDAEGFTEVIETTAPEQVGVHFVFKSSVGNNIEREELQA
jgi:uncharacterized Zn-binding protein involved in type VI secretion